MEKMNRLTYCPEPVAAYVREAAAQCGYDRFEEVLVDQKT